MKEALLAEQKLDNSIVIEEKVNEKRMIESWGELHKGHRVFEWDTNEGIVQPAKIEKKIVEIGTGPMRTNRTVSKIIIRPGCHYTPALNAENAIKRFTKTLGKK